jgi:glycosyltransferase involved in cell wall biosynthesis
VAPRGELSPGAFHLKRLKKWSYLNGARTLGLHRGVEWQATSAEEADDIKAAVGRDAVVHVASNAFTPICAALPPKRHVKTSGRARLLYLSRITSKKNLAFLLGLLDRVRDHVELTIVGVVDDDEYWRRCREIISRLPPSREVHYDGQRPHEQVVDVLAGHDFFVMPTLGENFGHAIVEALQAGVPVVVSDRTPWRQLESAQCGWDLPLDADAWVRVLDECVAMDADTHESLRLGARRQVSRILTVALEQNRAMFQNGASVVQ